MLNVGTFEGIDEGGKVSNSVGGTAIASTSIAVDSGSLKDVLGHTRWETTSAAARKSKVKSQKSKVLLNKAFGLLPTPVLFPHSTTRNPDR